MRLLWDENPLNTIVELNEHETEILWYKIKVEQMHWMFVGAHFHLEEGEYYDVDKARKELDPDYFWSEHDSTGEGDKKSKLDKRVDELLEYAIEELQQPHCGDCTCFAMTCGKCMAEEKLGLYTNKGLGKHEAAKIQNAFGEMYKPWKRTRNIHEVIEYLENYDAAENPPNWKDWEPHVERWNTEAKNACKWLKKYRNEHFSELTPQ